MEQHELINWIKCFDENNSNCKFIDLLICVYVRIRVHVHQLVRVQCVSVRICTSVCFQTFVCLSMDSCFD